MKYFDTKDPTLLSCYSFLFSGAKSGYNLGRVGGGEHDWAKVREREQNREGRGGGEETSLVPFIPLVCSRPGFLDELARKAFLC